jgi:hypothetical protein
MQVGIICRMTFNSCYDMQIKFEHTLRTRRMHENSGNWQNLKKKTEISVNTQAQQRQGFIFAKKQYQKIS